MASAETKRGTQVMTGADILVKSLVDHNVEVIFAYPGGCSMPMHQSLTKYGNKIRTILPRHEQGGGFAAQGIARSTGRVGVVMATSGPGATNLVTAIADAKLDSIPLIAITGQVPTGVIGTDAFQETPIVEVCRGITKHHYLVTKVDDVARVMKEAFHIATTGRPGPVLVDMPKDVQMDQCHVDWDVPMNLPGYRVKVPLAQPEQIRQIAAAIKHSKRPLLYAGGGVIGSEGAAALRKLMELTGIPITMTVMGLGLYPNDGPLSLDMLGMHGSAYANFAVRDCDLLIALGVRFDDRVTGKKLLPKTRRSFTSTSMHRKSIKTRLRIFQYAAMCALCSMSSTRSLKLPTISRHGSSTARNLSKSIRSITMKNLMAFFSSMPFANYRT